MMSAYEVLVSVVVFAVGLLLALLTGAVFWASSTRSNQTSLGSNDAPARTSVRTALFFIGEIAALLFFSWTFMGTRLDSFV
jgi:hypothetical protein